MEIDHAEEKEDWLKKKVNKAAKEYKEAEKIVNQESSKRGLRTILGLNLKTFLIQGIFLYFISLFRMNSSDEFPQTISMCQEQRYLAHLPLPFAYLMPLID